MNDELPCLDLLEATPAILRGLMSEISDEDARWKPAPDRFSIAEVLAHLSHSEGHCYRARVDRFLAEEMPELEPDDAQMHLELYKNGDPEEDFGHFEDQREANIELLRGLPAAAGQGEASRGGRDHALADAARVGPARPGARAADRGAGAGAEVPGGRGSAGGGLSAEAMMIRRLFVGLAVCGPRLRRIRRRCRSFTRLAPPHGPCYRTRIACGEEQLHWRAQCFRRFVVGRPSSDRARLAYRRQRRSKTIAC